ncbi:hypothetical protein AMAG_06129 [Allomyces macrogynus ATCC 38327]|uniref:Centrosomal protein POC5 n=1 Tax=Allomyces macrogynus (strain ATCC 38327) TaxID=578462 RepID=A0A0L0SE63_ALLM3|nr:hypothetical protein AMAG_06129 [Allomyces macrogynus ATCC 38327]|eukprot:KNE60771.1 hypothetical protein AMAG_06129 [Allomyces macrogynus ATCC 38327]
MASMPDVGTPHASTGSTLAQGRGPASASATPPRRCQTTLNTTMGAFVDLAGPAIPSGPEMELVNGPAVAPSGQATATPAPTGLPPHLDKWLVSLHSAFAADFLTLRANLDRAHQESLASERIAHSAEREKLAQALKTAEAAAARNAQAAKWRLQALDLLAHEFRERHAVKARVQAWTAWRAHLARRGHDRFKEHVAAVHAERQTKFRTVVAWRGVVRDRWRRAERAKIQAEFDRQLANRVAEHTAIVASLTQQLTEHADLLSALEQRHRDREDGIRMAFMRGLSALNLETMTPRHDLHRPHPLR